MSVSPSTPRQTARLIQGPRQFALLGTRRLPLAQLGLAGALLSTTVVVASASATPALLPESVRPIPDWLAGPLRDVGPRLPFAVIALLMGAMFISYVTAAARAERINARTLLLGIAALHAVVLLGPPLISTDVFSYQGYARMGAVYGYNPYLLGPSTISMDPLAPLIGSRWVTTPTVYGPIFTAVSYLFAEMSIAAATLSYRLLAAVSSLASMALLWRCARARGIDPRRVVALVGLNPLIVLYGVGGGHNDLMMLVPMLGGLLLLLTGRERAGAASVVAAAGIKLTAGLLLPFALAGARNPARDRRRQILMGAGLAAVAVLSLGFAIAGFGTLQIVLTLLGNQSRGDWHSISGMLEVGLGLNLIGHIAGGLLALGFVASFVWLLREVRRGRLDWVAAAGWSTFALLLSAGSVLPWYLAWLMPLAGLAGDRRLWRASMAMSAVVLGLQVLGYIPHGVLIFRP